MVQTLLEDERDEIDDEIVSSIPMVDRNFNTRNLLSRFTIEEYVVKQYEDANKWASKVGDKTSTAFFLSYFIIIAAFFIEDGYLNLDQRTQTIAFSLLFIVTFGVAFALWAGKKIFKNRAEKQLVDHDEAIYHRLSRTIREYQNGNYDNSMKELSSVKDLMSYKDIPPFSPEFSKELKIYITRVENEDSDGFYKETFPEVANKILQSLVTVYTSDLEYLYRREPSVEQADGYTPLNMFKSYLGDWTDNQVIRIVWPYILLAPILYIIYLQNETIAQIVTIIVVAVVQTYNKPRNEEN